MKYIKAAIAAGMLGILLTRLVAADDSVSLEQARRQALAHSKTLRKTELAVDAALLAERSNAYGLGPTISAEPGLSLDYPSLKSQSFADALTASASLSVTQTLYDGGKQAAVVRKSGVDVDITRAALRSQRLDVLDAAEAAYYAALKSSSSVDAALSDLESYRTHLALAQARLETGIIARAAYLEVQSETASKETTYTQAKRDLAVALIKLASLTGIPLPLKLDEAELERCDALMKRAGALDDAATQRLMSEVLAIARTNSPALTESDLAKRKSAVAAEIARKEYMPTLSANWSHTLTYSNGTNSTQAYSSGAGLQAGNGSLSLTMSIPLDFWNKKVDVDQAAVSLQEADLDVGETDRTLDLDVQSAVYDCLSSARSLGSSKKALEYAQANYQNILEQYKLSAASSSDLSDAESLVSANRTALIGARYQFLVNLSSLRTLSGLETDELLVKLIP